MGRIVVNTIHMTDQQVSSSLLHSFAAHVSDLVYVRREREKKKKKKTNLRVKSCRGGKGRFTLPVESY